MTKPLDPYSRVYWRVLSDERFDDVRSDMRHFGSWTLMLLVADMAYPAPAFIPSSIPKASRAKLVEVGLIESLPGGLYKVHGLESERTRRWSPRAPDGTPSGTGRDPERSLARATAETSKDETSKDKTSTARADPQERPAPADRIRYDRMVQRRIEWFRQTGKWDPEWGPNPEASRGAA